MPCTESALEGRGREQRAQVETSAPQMLNKRETLNIHAGNRCLHILDTLCWSPTGGLGVVPHEALSHVTPEPLFRAAKGQKSFPFGESSSEQTEGKKKYMIKNNSIIILDEVDSGDYLPIVCHFLKLIRLSVRSLSTSGTQ